MSVNDKFQSLNTVDLLESVFPYDKDSRVVFSRGIKKGIGGWPTLFIIIHRDFLNDDILVTICQHSEFTRAYYLENQEHFHEFINAINNIKTDEQRFRLYYNMQVNYKEKFLHINEMKRLYDYLEKQGIILFEPTE